MSDVLVEGELRLRNQAVDVAKGIAGVLVVLGHTLAFSGQESVLRQLTHLTTPLYIFLSGVFFQIDRPWRQSLWRLADALLKPYWVVLLGWGVWQHLITGEFYWMGYGVSLLYATGSSIVMVPLWILPHLLLCRVVGKWMLLRAQYIAGSKYFLVMAIPLMWWIGAHSVDWVWQQPLPLHTPWRLWLAPLTHWPGLPFSADVLLLTLPCLLAGYVLSTRVQKITFHLGRWWLAVLLASAALYAGAVFDINLRMVHQPMAVAVLMASGIYAVVSGAAGLLHWPRIAGVLAYFGRYFLLVLLLHMVVLRWLFGAMAAWFPGENTLLLSSMFIVGMLLSVLLIEVVKRSVVLSTLLLPLSQRAKAVR